MALNGGLHTSGLDIVFISPLVITTALTAATTTPVTRLSGMNSLTVEFIFTYGSGGTTADVYIQTTLNNGLTWFDVMNFHATTASSKVLMAVTSYLQTATVATSVVTTAVQVTPTDGSLTANTSVQGILGSQVRAKYTTTGTYATSTTLSVYGRASE